MKSKPIFIAVLVLIAVAAAVFFLRQNMTEEKPDTGQVQAPAANLPSSPPVGGGEAVRSFAYTDPSEWEHRARAQRSIESLAPHQEIVFGIVQDPTNPEISYFATQVFGTEKRENLVSIYSYNTKNYEWTRLFKSAYGAGKFPGLPGRVTPVMRVVGYDSGKLVLLVQDTDDSPGPCAEVLILESEQVDGSKVRRFVSMDIADPYAGFSDYTIPSELQDDAREKQDACLKEI